MADGISSQDITCPMCGFRFNPDEHPGCRSCPLHAGCATACCPRCGHTTINPRRSRLSRWLASVLKAGENDASEPFQETH